MEFIGGKRAMGEADELAAVSQLGRRDEGKGGALDEWMAMRAVVIAKNEPFGSAGQPPRRVPRPPPRAAPDDQTPEMEERIRRRNGAAPSPSHLRIMLGGREGSLGIANDVRMAEVLL
ncbi:MAG: hypothetical protein ACREQM_22630, partial [Candidatus Dormibacteraceae bacterium]